MLAIFRAVAMVAPSGPSLAFMRRKKSLAAFFTVWRQRLFLRVHFSLPFGHPARNLGIASLDLSLIVSVPLTRLPQREQMLGPPGADQRLPDGLFISLNPVMP